MTATTRLPQSAQRHNLTSGLPCERTKRMLCCDPRAGGFLHQGNAGRNEIHRTTSDPKLETVSSCTCGDWHERVRLACPCDLTSASLVNSTHIATVTGTGLTQFNSPHQHRINLSSHLNEFCTAVEWTTRQFQQSRGTVDIRILRLPKVK